MVGALVNDGPKRRDLDLVRPKVTLPFSSMRMTILHRCLGRQIDERVFTAVPDVCRANGHL
jgi:hypothetical protein